MQGLYPEPMGGCEVATTRRASLTERLSRNKADLESRLAEVNAALEALAKNPEFQTLFDLISKVS